MTRAVIVAWLEMVGCILAVPVLVLIAGLWVDDATRGSDD